MANNMTGDIWILDSTGAVYGHNCKIKTIIWREPSSLGDELILKNLAGKVILSAVCEADLQSQIFRLGRWYNGLTVDTIDSGKAYIHFY